MGWWIGGISLALLLGLALVVWNMASGHGGPRLVDWIDRASAGSREVAQLANVQLGDDPAVTAAVYAQPLGKGDAPRPVIVFTHGGGWNWGDPDDYGFIARSLASEGYVVVLTGYRLFPQVRFPAMLEDLATAVAWTDANIARFGGDPGRIVLMGHSAGAYNSLMLGLDRQWLADEGLDADRFAGVVSLAGPADFYPFDKESSINSFGQAPDPQATQPVNFARADAPPLLLVHGGADTVVRIRNSEALARAVAGLGGRVDTAFYPEMGHNDVLLKLASPWWRDNRVRTRVLAFLADVAPTD
ncbi:MAG: alpha/beta hydrolase [Sphingomonadaceae bacterium]